MADPGELPVAIRPRIQRLLLSDEYFEFEELVLVESAFAQVTRRGRGVRQVQIAVTPTKFIIATDEPAVDDCLFSAPADDTDPEADADTLEMVSIVPIECVNLSVFSRRRRKLKARFCNGRVYYFELSERGSLTGRSAASVWRQWEERVEFLCPNLNSSSSETSVANTSSTLSTLERRRSLRQLAAAGGQVAVSWFARGERAPSVGASQHAESSVWLTSDENDTPAAKTRPAAQPRPARPARPAAVPPLNTAAPANTGTSATDSSTTSCSTCGSSCSQCASSTTTVKTGRTARSGRASKKSAAGEAAGRVEAGDAPPRRVASADKRRSQTLMVNRFGTGVEEKCTLNLYLSSDSKLDLTTSDNQRLGALQQVADDTLQLWELAALGRKRRHTRHSVLTPLAERQAGWPLLAPTARRMARVRRSASETRLGPVAVRRRVCGQTRDAEFHLPLRRGDLCAAASLEQLPAALSAAAEAVSALDRPVFWRPEHAERPATARTVYIRRLELLRDYRGQHERLRAAESRRKTSKVARGISKLSARAKQSGAKQAIKSTYKQIFRSLSSTGRGGKKSESEESQAGRRAASESRLSGGSQPAGSRPRSASFSPGQRPRHDQAGGSSSGFCRFLTPRRNGSPEPDALSQDRLSLRSDLSGSATSDAASRVTSRVSTLLDGDALSLEPSLADSVSGTTVPERREELRADPLAPVMPGCTTLRRVREIDSAVLAHQMTLMDREMFGRVSAVHLAGLAALSDPRLRESIVTVLLFFHRVVCLVTTNVLLESTDRDRAKVITKLVTVAERCYHLRNFHSCKAVLSGLQTVPIFRLRRTWDYMKTKHDRKYRAFKSLSKLFADPRLPAYQRLAADVAASGQPFIPFFGDVIGAMLGYNRPPPPGAGSVGSPSSPRSPVLSWVRRHFESAPPEEALAVARRRVLQRKYVTRWRTIVRCRRLAARRYRPTWLQRAAEAATAWPDEAAARRRLRARVAEEAAAVAMPAAVASRAAHLWARWRRAAETYCLEERPLVREYLSLARHYTMETALGLSLDREPPDGSSCTLCSNTGVGSDSSAEPLQPVSTNKV